MKKLLTFALAATLVAGLNLSPVGENISSASAAPISTSTALPAKSKAKKAIALKLSVSDKTPYVGQTVSLKATVKKGGKAVKGATVVFKRSHAMEDSTATLGKAKTNKNGVATLKRKVAKWDGGYSAGYAGKIARGDIYAHANLSWSLPSKKTITRGQSLKFTVKSPSFQGSMVELQQWNAKRKKWMPAEGLVQSSSPFNSRVNSDCKFHNCAIIGSKGKVAVKLWYFESKGTHKFRLFQEGIQVHDNSVSKPVTITVK